MDFNQRHFSYSSREELMEHLDYLNSKYYLTNINIQSTTSEGIHTLSVYTKELNENNRGELNGIE
ncbi:hypothetical protein JTZ62_05245 [Mammaliicoccus sciuri]|uniref:hypothetical protein n=1 Tax=Mammaliicoccus sciuri TaxID=1296 RepID=UPI0019D3483D|nr:hypothetical protein [Mammaliicoccus sciuri]QSN68562.1 hypothetical protein JTZ62_05245 [Mammaliicoccus sciuri]UIU23307.1 hypothetical protein LLZ87_05260 [Mammaliicoccus sciuri]UIU26213.1 hypothetical protein LLZ92_05260 [Mammaliicoccus sciuri]